MRNPLTATMLAATVLPALGYAKTTNICGRTPLAGKHHHAGGWFVRLHRVLWRWAIVCTAAFAGTGCATNVLPVYQLTSAHKHQAMEVARHTALPPSRRTPRAELVAVVERVRQRMRPAGLIVCREVFTTNCPESLASMRVMVWLDDGNINAFAREDGVLGFNGGLIQAAGTDDEIAMVMGHEMAHVMFGHNAKKASNEGLGMLFGLALGMGATYDIAPYMDERDLAQVLQGSMSLFQHAGALAYSPEMELEADTLSAHMVHEAGYDVNAAKGFLIRTARIGAAAGPANALSMVGFLGSHPSDDRRLAHWDIVAAKAVSGLRPGW